jgi:WD40 repeat protein
MKKATMFFIFMTVTCSIYPQEQAAVSERDTPVETIIQLGHTAQISFVNFSVNGRYYISVDENRKVIIWDIATGRQIREYTARTFAKGVDHMYFDNQNDNIVYLCDKDGMCDVYDFQDDRRIGMTKLTDVIKRVNINIKDAKLEVPYDASLIVHGIEIRDKETGKLVSRLQGHASAMKSIAIVNERQILVTNEDILYPYEYTVAWDLKNAKPLYTAESWMGRYGMKVRLSPDNKHFLVSHGGNIEFRKIESGEQDFVVTMPFDTSTHTINDALFSPDGKSLLVAATNGLYLVDMQTRTVENHEIRFEGKDECGYTSPPFRNIRPLKDDEFLLSNTEQIFKGSFAAPFVLSSTNSGCGDIRDFSINPAQTHGVYTWNGDYRKTYLRWKEDYRIISFELSDTQWGQLMYVKPKPFIPATYTACNYVSNAVVAGGQENGKIHLFRDSSHTFIKTLENAHKAAVTDIQPTPDGRFFLSSSDDGSVCLWNAQSYELTATLVALNKGMEYVILTPDNYYMASRNAFEGIHFVKGKEVFGFEQFDLQYNRPDIVLSRIGYSSPDLVQLFRKSYEKRLRKMKFTEDMFSSDFHVPQSRITNKAELQKGIGIVREAVLDVACTDSRYRLNRINVWINNVPIYGVQGLDVSKSGAKDIRQQIKLSLASGANLVEISCLNEHGVESWRDNIEIFAPESARKPDLYVFSIGVSEFARPGYNLNYAHKDASDIASMMQDVNRERFGNVFATTLVNSQVTRKNIIALREKLKSAKTDDVVAVFYAGHGLLDDQFDYYLATYDTDFDNPAVSALPYEELENLMDGIAPLKKILMVDACHAGEIDREDVLLAEATNAAAMQSGSVKFREVGIRGRQTHEAAEINQLMKQYFAGLQRGVGATVIASSGGLEAAIEGDRWQNGLFTYVLKDGILNKKADDDHDGTISVSEIQHYANREVATLSDNRQQPSSRIENRQSNFIIAY